MTIYGKIFSAVFALVAILHALRIINQWEAVIGGWNVPMWLSGLAIVLASILSVIGYKISYKK